MSKILFGIFVGLLGLGTLIPVFVPAILDMPTYVSN